MLYRFISVKPSCRKLLVKVSVVTARFVTNGRTVGATKRVTAQCSDIFRLCLEPQVESREHYRIHLFWDRLRYKRTWKETWWYQFEI